MRFLRIAQMQADRCAGLAVQRLGCMELPAAGETRLFFALFRLIRPEVFDFTLLGASFEAYDASFLLSFDPCEIIKFLLFLVYDLSSLVLELVEHFTVVLLALTFVVSELQFHSRRVVGVFLDP